jgi:hypothetical protein
MLFHRTIEKTVSISFRCFEDGTPGIQEGGKRGDKRKEFLVGTESLQEGTAIIDALQGG